jgi:hypothetical protein
MATIQGTLSTEDEIIMTTSSGLLGKQGKREIRKKIFEEAPTSPPLSEVKLLPSCEALGGTDGIDVFMNMYIPQDFGGLEPPVVAKLRASMRLELDAMAKDFKQAIAPQLEDDLTKAEAWHECISPVGDRYTLIISSLCGSHEKYTEMLKTTPSIRKLSADTKDWFAFQQKINNQLHTKCATCSRPGCFEKCARCKKIYYCGKTCQRSDWPHHKLSCNKAE